MDNLSKDDQAFYKKLLASFKIESKEHIKELTDGLAKIEKDLSDKEFDSQLQVMFRAAHSLKGASRAVNMIAAETICQSVENVLSSLKKTRIKPSNTLISTLYESMDILEDLVREDKDSLVSLDPNNHSDLLDRLDSLIKTNPIAVVVDELPVQIIAKEESKVFIAPSIKKQEVAQTIRTSSVKIDALLEHVEEMLMIKLSSQLKVSNLKDLQSLLLQGEKEFRTLNVEKVIRSFGHKDEKFHNLANQLSIFFENQKQFLKGLKDSLNKLSRLCEQDHRAICGMVDSVLNDTKEILMLSFSTILDSFPRMVRELSKSLGKEAILTISGAEIEIDRRILEQLKDPLIHILRNSLDHGIEPPEERERNKKSSQGNIKISAFQTAGNTVKIVIEDDGKGINVEKIKQVGLQKGILSQEEANTFSEKEAYSLIFHPGFSTNSTVTEVSGRGIGMSVLSENIERLGGKVSIESKPKQGTTIQIHLPLTLATFRGIHIQACGQDYIMPTHHVDRVFKISQSQIKKVENRQMVSYEGKVFSYIFLGEILNLPASIQKEKNDLIVLMVRASETLMGIGIDKIVSEQEVFVKGLGPQLKHVPYISSATVMEWGKVIPVLDPFDLIKSIQKSSFIPTKNTSIEQKIEVSIKTILVAEDSATTRMLLKNILESAGYCVKSAVDGIEAFSVLGSEKVDLVLSDVEMPKMNGFELTAKIRDTESLKNIPVVLCTSRGSKEDRERGLEVGANAYLDKSGFMQSNLLEVIGLLL